jgi:hypothetical protein
MAPNNCPPFAAAIVILAITVISSILSITLSLCNNTLSLNRLYTLRHLETMIKVRPRDEAKRGADATPPPPPTPTHAPP